MDCSSPSCIDPIFGPTAAASYWSSSSVAGFPADAWAVDFLFGIVFTENKSEVGPGPVRLYARAVRGGP